VALNSTFDLLGLLRSCRQRTVAACLVVIGLGVLGGALARAATIEDREFRTSDGVRLHYLEAGTGDPTLVVIPGWLMPAQLFESQLSALSAHRRVVVLDPRSQGQSELFDGPHTPLRRALDIREFVEHVGTEQFVLAGWSLGVMEGLDYVERFRPQGLRGLVLIDNSIGEASPPKRAVAPPEAKPRPRSERMKAFVQGLFERSPPPALLSATETSVLRVPEIVAAELLAKPYPREYYKNAIYRANVPVLYAIRPKFAEQGAALQAHLSTARVAVYPDAGHALFVDDAERFNRDVEGFLGALN
jgi:microsomal epoxide hydrolase